MTVKDATLEIGTIWCSETRRLWIRYTMCGRFGLFTDLAELIELLGFEPGMLSESYVPRWNIAPTDPVVAIRRDGSRRIGTLMRWGLIPRWAKVDNAFKRPMFNARSETVMDRPMFREAFANRRCLIPADGFYEWDRKGKRGPLWVHHAEGKMITFAAISSLWHGTDGDVESCAILTTPANSLMLPIHDRMPVMLTEEWAEIWLDYSVDKSVLEEAMRPREWDGISVKEAHPDVGSSRNDGPELLRPQSTLFDL